MRFIKGFPVVHKVTTIPICDSNGEVTSLSDSCGLQNYRRRRCVIVVVVVVVVVIPTEHFGST